VEGILGAAAMGGGVDERVDGLEQLHHRAGPTMGHDQRQRIGMARLHVDEVDVEAVDLGDELRQGIEPRLGLAPVVAAAPVPHQRLQFL